MASAKGWKLKLNVSEKSLSQPLIFDKKLRFTTFQPTGTTTTTCGSTSSSTSRYYVMNLEDATPSPDRQSSHSSSSTAYTKEDRSSDIEIQGIASSPALVFPPDGNSVEVYVGKENVGSVSQKVKTIYWKQQE